MTPLGGHVDWAGEFGDISELRMYDDLNVIQLTDPFLRQNRL